VPGKQDELRDANRRIEDALTLKCGEVEELQRRLFDAETRIRQQSAAARSAAETATEALLRLEQQEPVIKAATAWAAVDRGDSDVEHDLMLALRAYQAIVKARS
jgi:predicted  nucleic acid-binding Zn-ribbon protein